MGRGLRLLAGMLAAMLALAGMTCLAEPASENITKKCRFKVTDGNKKALTDGSYRSDWNYDGSEAKVGVALPQDETAGAMVIYWTFEPFAYEVTEYDANWVQLRLRDQSCTFPSIESYLDLLPETKYVIVRLTQPKQSIAEVRIYSQGSMPDKVHPWEAPVEKADLMVVSAHQDDELIFFGGVIPYYAVAQQRPTVVVYMANCTRHRRQEALNGLWAMGVRNYPEFINLKDKRVKTLQEGIDLWDGRDHILEELVERIRRYKPEVIVTHDFNGEYGHNQHRLTARAMPYAIEAAADSSRYPASAEKYGTWQVKKLYIHLYGKNQVHMDWKTPLNALGGKSPLEVAVIGYDQHVSQQKYYQVNDGGKYDNALFGLFQTTVGQDTGKNDMFENISASLPSPAPTITPTATPTEEPQENVILPEVTPEPDPVSEKSAPNGWAIVLSVAGGATVIGIAAWMHARTRRRRRHRRRRRARR